MNDHVYRKTALVGSSAKSIDDAISTALARASKTVRNIEWFEVDEIRGSVKDGKVQNYQVSLNAGFRVE
jgi:flavin-binding protein dodecin